MPGYDQVRPVSQAGYNLIGPAYEFLVLPAEGIIRNEGQPDLIGNNNYMSRGFFGGFSQRDHLRHNCLLDIRLLFPVRFCASGQQQVT
jgi:hypothetical protein